jgi:hypothetical protein
MRSVDIGRYDMPMPARTWGLVVGAALALAACDDAREPIVVQRTSVILENQSSSEWTGIEIWVNDHYRVTYSALAPGGRLNVPLTSFVAGFGQRFPPATNVFGVEVTAKSGGGEPVRLIWGKGRRR